MIQDTNNQNITITIPSNKDTNLKDPHDANQLLKPSKYSKRLVAIFKRVEDIRITSISRTFDVEYLPLLNGTCSTSQSFIVKTNDVPECNIDESRIRGLQGTYHSMHSLVEVEKKQTINMNDDEIVGVFGTCPCPLETLILDGNDIANVLLRDGRPTTTNTNNTSKKSIESTMSGFASLMHAVSSNPTMKNVSLAYNFLGDVGANIVAKILSHPHNRTNLISINLNHCNIANDGYISLLRMLKINTHLKRVSLISNMISSSSFSSSSNHDDLLEMLGGSSSSKTESKEIKQSTPTCSLTKSICEVMLGLRQSMNAKDGNGTAWEMKWVCPETGIHFSNEERWIRWKGRNDNLIDAELAKEEEIDTKKKLLASFQPLFENDENIQHFIQSYLQYGLIKNIQQVENAITFFKNENIASQLLNTNGGKIHDFDMERGCDFEKAIGLSIIATKSTDPNELKNNLKTKISKKDNEKKDKNQPPFSYYGGCMTENMHKKVIAEELNSTKNNARIVQGTGMVRYDITENTKEEKKMNEDDIETNHSDVKETEKKEVVKQPLKHLEERRCLWMNAHLYRSEKEHQCLKKYRLSSATYLPTRIIDIINNKYDIHTVNMNNELFEKIVGKGASKMLELGPTYYEDCMQRVVISHNEKKR